MELILILPSLLYLAWRIHVSAKHEAPLPRESSILIFVILVLLTQLVTPNLQVSRTVGIAIILVEALLSGVLFFWGNRVYNRWLEEQKNKDDAK